MDPPHRVPCWRRATLKKCACRWQRAAQADEALFADLSLVVAAAQSFPEPNVVLIERSEAGGRAIFGFDDADYIQRQPEGLDHQARPAPFRWPSWLYARQHRRDIGAGPARSG